MQHNTHLALCAPFAFPRLDGTSGFAQARGKSKKTPLGDCLYYLIPIIRGSVGQKSYIHIYILFPFFCLRGVPLQQFYNLTHLKKSKVRWNDEL